MATEEEFERWEAQRRPEDVNTDPEVKAKPEVKFLTGDDAGLPKLPPAKVPTVKVRVREPYRMVHNGIHTAGDVFDAPHNDETRLWLRQGWIELVPPAKATAPKTTKEK